ncbi:MAG TPA: 50S ribosomal protein P1 [Candidatus Nanoarchaeia archaeon]|nr:50S ribosomal protein P1 [Candidatus Nanoarchaeia archaeon]
MEYVYSAMLLHSAKKPVTEDSVKKVLQAAGVSPDEGRIKALVAALDGVDIDAAIKEAAIPMAAPVAVASSNAPAHAPAAKKEEKKSEEQAAAGLAGLFG